jgi:excisionase family DNA binding protein
MAPRSAVCRPQKGDIVPMTVTDRLLTVEQAADRLNTKVRFVRRLIEERRIAYTKVGRYVRIPNGAVDDLIRNGFVEPLVRRRGAA